MLLSQSFVVTDLICILSYLFCGAFFYTAKFKIRFEESLPMAIFSIVAALYVFGIFGFLRFGFYTVSFLIAIGFILGLILIVKDVRTFSKNFFSPGLLIYSVWCAIIYVFFKDTEISTHDDLNHWALVSKNTFVLDSIPVGKKSNTTYQDYPPATALFQYFLFRIKGAYSDPLALFSMSLWGFAILIYPLKNLQWKSCAAIMLYSLSGFAILTMFRVDQNYDSRYYTYLMVDYLMAIIFGYSLILAASINKNTTKIYCVNFILTLCVLVVVKGSGAFLALVSAAVGIYNFLNENQKIAPLKTHNPHLIFKKIKICSKVFLYKSKIVLYFLTPVIFTFLSWKIFCSYNEAIISGVNKGFYSTLLDICLLNSHLKSYAVEVFFIYLKGWYTLVISNGGLQISYLAFIIIVHFGIYFLYQSQTDKKIRKKIINNYFVILGFFIIYILGHLMMYIFVLSDGESHSLSSFLRYLFPFSVGIFFFATGILMMCGFKEGNFNCRMAAYFLMLMACATFNLNMFAKRVDTPDSELKSKLISQLENDVKMNDKAFKNWAIATLENIKNDNYEATSNSWVSSTMDGMRSGHVLKRIYKELDLMDKVVRENLDVNDANNGVCIFEGIPGSGYGYAFMLRNKIVPLRVGRSIALNSEGLAQSAEEIARIESHFKNEMQDCNYLFLIGVNEAMKKNYRSFFGGPIIQNGFYSRAERADGNFIFTLKDCSICKI